MTGRSALVGRRVERERLGRALAAARQGGGSLLLLAGEAGIGKTRLADELAEGEDVLVLSGRARQGATAPYGPVVAALRSYLRARPDGLDASGPLRPHLALILPELGDAAPAGDRDTLVEAVRCAFEHMARSEPVLLLLDDLQWSDDATLELLAAIAPSLGRLSLLVIAGYRSDGLPRDHMLRRLRQELRRGGYLDELTLAPLAPAETAELLAEILGDAPAPALVATIHDRTQGLPFFVEELAGALLASNFLTAGPRGLDLAADGEVPVPETIRDAVLMGTAELSREARAAVEGAAVAGEAFDLELVEEVSSAAGLAELLERELIREDGLGRGAFRHALVREALYADVPWLERRALHRRTGRGAAGGGRLRDGGGDPLAGSARRVPCRATRCCGRPRSRAPSTPTATRRGPGARRSSCGRRGTSQERRIAVLESYAGSAELAGELAEAARAWREICALQAGSAFCERLAVAQRRLAAVHGLTGDRESAIAARRAAAEAYAAAGRPAEAAIERLAIADHLRAASEHTEAIEVARTAGEEAGVAERLDLRARALGLEGVSLATRGDFDAGLRTVQAGLALALEHGLTLVAAELYQRLSTVLYDAADYRRAQETLDTALELCRTGDAPMTELLCVTCMVYVLRECGEWERALEIGRDLVARRPAPCGWRTA